MRTHYCGEVNENLVNQTVELFGWVNRRRDLGGVIFINLRDREGIVQVVCRPENKKIFNIAEQVRHEYVLSVKGKVQERPEGMRNPDMVTGKIEIDATDIEILNISEALPFELDTPKEIGEETRLKYRYIDLRRPEMFNNLKLRSKIAHASRTFLDKSGFLEVETPMLTRPTPEGARDYLVPSRVRPGNFYALPQSPQLFKELLMIAGIDRYYQIVRCFRDEDLRADRQPEFTQIDIEMSFMSEEEIQALIEEMVCDVFKQTLNVKLPKPFPRMTYQEAMNRYGSDKPDLRIPLEFADVTELFKEVEFKVFKETANAPDGKIIALRMPNGLNISRKQIDDYVKYVGIYGAKGLSQIKVVDMTKGLEGVQSPIAKFLSESVIKTLIKQTQAQTGDIIFLGADKTKVVQEFMGALRLKLGEDHQLMQEGWKPLWVIDFPMFEEKEGQLNAMHHPFTAPKSTLEELKNSPATCLARAYDMVLNGVEIGGGSIRINDINVQKQVLNILGIDESEANEKFGFLLEAMKYGCPPLGGIAFGFDRLAMLMTNNATIREVIAFPKTTTASCLLTDAPANVSEQQLKELHICIDEKNKKK